MSRRGGQRQKSLTHSIKKLVRRHGAPGVVKAKKAKRREPTHPGHKVLSVNAKRRAALMSEDEEAAASSKARPAGTEGRAQARIASGKQARLEELARRRGILPSAKLGQHGGSEAMAEEDTGDTAEDPALAVAAANAAKRALAFAPPNQRSFHKELSTVLKSADVLLEVLDARDPMGCRCKPLEDAILAKCKGKRLVIILNKVDLVPPDVVQRWLTYLRQYFPTLPFKAATQQGHREIGRSSNSAAAGKLASYGADAYGGDGLLQLLKNYSRSMGMKTAITVGIVGYPNVGKSSLINSLKRVRAVDVGATPGVTTVAQTVALDSKVKLMDCPGIVFARATTAEEQAEVVLRNCVRVEKLDDVTVPVEAILRRCTTEQLMRQYDVASFSTAIEFLTLVAAKRGHLRKGGAADHDAAARAVLQDWNAGSIKYFTEPPKPSGGVEFAPVFADSFDWHAPPRVETAEETAAEAAAAGRRQAGAERLAAKGEGRSGGVGGGSGGTGGSAMADDEEGQQQQLLAGWKQAHERSRDAKPKPARPPTKRSARVTLERQADEHYNFQLNRGIRKSQQAEKKKQRRRLTASLMLM